MWSFLIQRIIIILGDCPMKKISIIVPMYNESQMVQLFMETLTNVFATSLPDYDYEVIAVNDGSKDNTLELLKIEQERNHKIVILDLSRNWGQEAAVCAGLNAATGDCVIPMDSDLQDPPELLPELIKAWEDGAEVVNAYRSSRKLDTAFKRNTAGLYYKILDKLSPKVKIPGNVNNFRLLDRKVVDHINALTENNRVFRVQVPFVGFKTATVQFARRNRAKGESHYPLKSMISLAMDSVTSLSSKPLKWSIGICVFFLLAFLASGIAELVVYIVGINTVLIISEEIYIGWLIINVMLLGFFLITFVLAIFGVYLSKIYDETQNRPSVIVREVIKK